MIRPLLKDDALLTAIRSTDEGPNHFILWWLGHSGFILKWHNEFLLFDPYLSDSLSNSHPDSDSPFTRMTELVVNPALLDFVDAITCSHRLPDHFDPDTIRAIASVCPKLKLILPAAELRFAREQLGDNTPHLIPMNEGQSETVGKFKITAIAADHAQHPGLGYIVEFGPWRIYHSGDTHWHPALVPALVAFKPQLMLLPINGNSQTKNLSAPEAATLARACSADMVIPCHYNLFEINTTAEHEFAETCDKIRQPHRILLNGECWTSRSIGA